MVLAAGPQRLWRPVRKALAACPDRVLSSMGRRGPRWSGRNHLAANCTANRKSRQSGFLEITLFTLLRRFESTKKNIKLYSDLAWLLVSMWSSMPLRLAAWQPRPDNMFHGFWNASIGNKYWEQWLLWPVRSIVKEDSRKFESLENHEMPAYPILQNSRQCAAQC